MMIAVGDDYVLDTGIPMTSYFKGTDNGVNPIHRGINDPKRPFRINNNTVRGIGVLSVLLVIHGGEP